MPRKPSKPRDLKVMCSIWQDDAFRALTIRGQYYCFKSVAMLGINCSTGGLVFTNADLGLNELDFLEVARELTWLGVWTYVDDFAVEVWPYRDLIIPFEKRNRARIPIPLRQQVLARDGYRCRQCGATERLEMDHIHPWSKGGEDTLENLQVLCRSCNFRKGDRSECLV